MGGYRQFRLLGMGRYLQITGRFTYQYRAPTAENLKNVSVYIIVE
jgi:hypothetical protein